MRLGDYLTETGETYAQFGERIEVDESSVSRYCNGRVPRPKIMARIIVATDGRVTANDFVTQPEVDRTVNPTGAAAEVAT